MKHANVAIFVPHKGCRHQCSFCDQKAITGSGSAPSSEEVETIIQTAILQLGKRTQDSEIAFFGGSFTAIDRSYMLKLLATAFPYIKNHTFSGIRISTRPDAITKEILLLLKEYGVSSIELGAQSMDDEVLQKNYRGHTKSDVIKASNLIKAFGFSLGLQMMTGLYGSDEIKDYHTAEELIQLCPDTVRVYPTIVMEHTLLEQLYYSKEYTPPSLEETVVLCSRLLTLFDHFSIPVIRLGLQDTPSLQNHMVAGPWHPALRELCQSRIFLEKTLLELKKQTDFSNQITIYIHPKSFSQMVGYKKSNIKQLNDLGYQVSIKEDEFMKTNDFRIENCR